LKNSGIGTKGLTGVIGKNKLRDHWLLEWRKHFVFFAPWL